MNRVGRLAHFAAVAALAASTSLGTLGAHESQAFAAQPASAEPAQTAEQLANTAYEQHAAGKYAEAIATYLRAYEISKTGAILLNVATIYDRKMHERALASEYYRRYLLAPDADPDHVKKANERLTALKKEMEAEEAARNAAPTPVPAVPDTPAPSGARSATSASSSAGADTGNANDGKSLRTAGIVLTVTGVLSLGASAVFGIVAKGKNDDANALCDGTACRSDRGVTLAKDAGTFATVSTITFIAGLTLAGGGLSMFFLAPKKQPSASSAQLTISPRLGMSQAGLNVTGSF